MDHKSPNGKLGNLSALKDFISLLATVSGDLSNITAPPFILAPQSLTEFPAYSAERPALFAAPAHEPSPERRLLLVLQNYLASLHRQYYIGRPVKEGTKKPLNPFLGELFFCQCEDEAGKAKVKVISEQVSHHPPTTAAYMVDEENGVRAEAYSTQATALSGTSIVVRQSGHALVTIDKYNETYLMPFPDVWAKNVLTGVPYPELYGTYRIISTSGYTAEIRFGSKPRKLWQSGERNSFEATIYQTSDSDKKAIFELGGSWSDQFETRDSGGNVLETYDIADQKNQPRPLQMPSIDEQSPWESRRAWRDVVEGLKTGDFSAALSAKSKLENGQRQMRKRERAEGKTWNATFFTKREVDQENIHDDEVYSKLVQLLGGQDDAKGMVGTHGDWRFDHEKEMRWREGKGESRPETPMG